MRVISVPIEAIADAEHNANKMSAEKFRLLVESIRRIGFVQHVVVRAAGEGQWEMVDGHHRRDAMAQLGENQIPAVELEGDEDPRLVALAMNRIRGETDLAVASEMIDELMSTGFAVEDLAISGFTERELSELVAAAREDDDLSLADVGDVEVPEPVGTPVHKPFLLELTFSSKDDLAEARKALRRAAGKGGAMSDGLLRLIRAE